MTGNPSIRMHVNKTENRISFKIKKGIISNFPLLKQWNNFEVLKKV